MERLKYVLVSILVFVYFLLEYAWIPWADVPIYIEVPYQYTGEPVRLDSYIYNACVKVEHMIIPGILLLLTPFRKASLLMLAAFFLALVEFPFTWNEPIAQVPLPFEWYIPVSTTPLKFASVCYFMYECVKKALNGNGK